MIRRIHAPTIPPRQPSKLLTPAYVLVGLSVLILACLGSAWLAARMLAQAYLSLP